LSGGNHKSCISRIFGALSDFRRLLAAG
jgi:hypothetical protein